MVRCCNTCEDVREAYRQKGWAFNNAHEIEQCSREGFSDKMKEQKNEGCRIFGYLEVNKVGMPEIYAYINDFELPQVDIIDGSFSMV